MAIATNSSGDNILTSYTAHNIMRTYAFWIYIISDGGGDLGRFFDKRVISAEVELMLINADGIGNDGIYYNRIWDLGDGDT